MSQPTPEERIAAIECMKNAIKGNPTTFSDMVMQQLAYIQHQEANGLPVDQEKVREVRIAQHVSKMKPHERARYYAMKKGKK